MAPPSRPPATSGASGSSKDSSSSGGGGDNDSGLGLLFFIGVGLLLGVVGFVALLARDMDMFKPQPQTGFNPPGFTCKVLGRGAGGGKEGPSFIGVEDLVLVANPSSSSAAAGLPR